MGVNGERVLTAVVALLREGRLGGEDGGRFALPGRWCRPSHGNTRRMSGLKRCFSYFRFMHISVRTTKLSWNLQKDKQKQLTKQIKLIKGTNKTTFH